MELSEGGQNFFIVLMQQLQRHERLHASLLIDEGGCQNLPRKMEDNEAWHVMS